VPHTLSIPQYMQTAFQLLVSAKKQKSLKDPSSYFNLESYIEVVVTLAHSLNGESKGSTQREITKVKNLKSCSMLQNDVEGSLTDEHNLHTSALVHQLYLFHS